MLLALWILAAGAAAQERITLSLEIDGLRDEELFTMIRAAVKPDILTNTVPRMDLVALERLWGRLESSLYSREVADRLSTLELRSTLERLMREELGRLSLADLRRMALGDRQTPGHRGLVPVFYEKWIEEEVAKALAAGKEKPVFPANPPPWPKDAFYLPGAAEMEAPELRRAVGPFAQVLAGLAQQKPRGLMAEGQEYAKLEDAFMSGTDDRAAARLLEFAWDSFCGTGSGSFENRRMMIVLLGLLRERRLAEALGASFFVPDSPRWMHEPGRPFDPWRMELLKFCGFDGEDVMMSAGHVEYLAAAGSEKAARHAIAALKATGEEDPLADGLRNLALFLIPGDPKRADAGDPRSKISPATQAEILARFDQAGREEVPFQRLDYILSIFEELHRPEMRETLHRLLRHPSTTYAARAAWALRWLGEVVEVPAPAPPARFRFYLNDQPWRSRRIAYRLTGGGYGSGSVKTDAEGFGTIPRDDFLDPGKRGPRLAFFCVPNDHDFTDRPYDDAWVSTEVEVPRAFDETGTVKFAASALPLEITYGTPPPPANEAGTRIRVSKAGEKDPNAWVYSILYTSSDRKAPTKFTLRTLATGRYQVFVLAPGSARFLSEPIEVKPGLAPPQLKLEKGSHVYASIWAPANGRGAGEVRLFRGDEDLTEQYRGSDSPDGLPPLFAGVPRGNYRLRVLSTAEFMRKFDIKEWKAEPGRFGRDPTEDVDCEGATVEFTIDDQTPALLDLGHVESQAVEAMRARATEPRMYYSGRKPQ
jgi:hypothetical protein